MNLQESNGGHIMKIIRFAHWISDEPMEIYECEFCGKRWHKKRECKRCEINCNHKEEFSVQNL